MSSTGTLRGVRIAMISDQPAMLDARALRQIEELTDAGATVAVWANANRPKVRQRRVVSGGVSFHQEPPPSRVLMRLLPRVTRRAHRELLDRRIYREVADFGPDVVAHHDVRSLALAAQIAERSGRPLVSDLPDLPPEDDGGGSNQMLKPPPYRPKPELHGVMLRYYGTAKFRLTAAPALAEVLTATYGGNLPEVLLNVPRRSECTPGRGADSVRRHVSLSRGEKLLVYVGDVKPGRNVEVILSALALVGKWRLAIVGADQPKLERFFAGHSLAQDLRARIAIVPRQPDWQLPNFLADADAGIHIMEGRSFNKHHAAPNKFFAMALAGIPLIVSGAYMSQEVQRLALGIALDAPTARSVADALESLENWSPLDMRAHQQVRVDYGWRRQAQTLLKLYAAAAENRAGMP